VLVTTRELYRRKVAKVRAELPTLEHVLEVDTPEFARLMDQASEEFETARTAAEDMALLHFTSGTTGRPKGAVHVHGAVLTHYVTGRYALDLHPEDVFWCTADPGWVTGTWYRILEEQKVSVWYTAPTAIRMLMKTGAELARKRSYPALRFVASVGEPLNPEAVWWGEETLGLPIHDNWWQTETGGIMVSNFAALDVKPGSMGLPVPGVDAEIVHRTETGIQFVKTPDTEGELALKAGWPSMFRGYLHEDERYRKCFRDGWYLSGDLAKRDADGYYWFVGRADDVIKSAGHLIGPFEVESVLMEHPAVAEAGVIGKPDPTVGEMVKAFVSLKQGFSPSENLKMQLLGHARKRLGAAVAPKEIEIQPSLPKTRSGKIMRRLLRELAAHGEIRGDTTTLEDFTVIAKLREAEEG
jgi:acetyl-CoA synthetase